MNIDELFDIIKQGEDSQNQFKENFSNHDSLAAEIVAFANTRGGKIIVGVTDSCEIKGLTEKEVANLNQMISNVCSQKIDPIISVRTENILYNETVVVIIYVPMGTNKFYMSNGKDVWVKVGADKRRAKREEMQRLLQESSKLYADEQIIENTSMKDLDTYLLTDFLEKRLEVKIDSIDMPIENMSLEKLLSNMKILSDNKCTLAGLLLFAKSKKLELSNCSIGAVSWYGNELSGTEYRDSEDIQGNALKIFNDGMNFIKRQLYKLQNGQNFNSLGILEIPEIALQEALINAIVHRNYFINSNIRILVFDNRVEIVSPGVLPNTLTVETIKTGVHIVRNPILLSHIRDIPNIPYRGMGTGISRILKSCKEVSVKVDLINQIDAEQFKIIFWRNMGTVLSYI